MSRVQVPFTGQSTQRSYQLTLTDNQLRLLDKMVATCGQVTEETKPGEERVAWKEMVGEGGEVQLEKGC